MFQSLGLRNAQLFAPSSWEEQKTGYDQRVVGFSRFREVLTLARYLPMTA